VRMAKTKKNVGRALNELRRYGCGSVGLMGSDSTELQRHSGVYISSRFAVLGECKCSMNLVIV